MTFSCYITFPTTYFAIRAESLLKSGARRYKMVPVPRSISSSCGTALLCDCDDMPFLRKTLLNGDLELEGFYRLEEEGLKVQEVKELFFDEPDE